MPLPFPVRILTMGGPVFDGEALSLTVPMDHGPLFIERGYTNFMGTLSKAGVLKLVTKEKTYFYAVFGGIVDVRKGGTTTVYCEEINPGYSIDLARAIAARDRNLDRIAKHEDGIDILRAKAKLAKALVRISVKEMSEGAKKD